MIERSAAPMTWPTMFEITDVDARSPAVAAAEVSCFPRDCVSEAVRLAK
jgi:hypothetical protein